ncbi:MAG: ABC transporter permease [Rhodospirillales bacterium]
MSLFQDMQFGIRMLRKDAGFTIAAVLALALGIGANTAIFSIVYAVLLRPLPYPEPSRIMIVMERTARGSRNSIAPANFLDWREQATSFESMSAYASGAMTLTGQAQPERLPVLRASAGFLDVLGCRPVLGRAFTPEEDRPGAGGVALLSYAMWERRFAGDSGVIGRTLHMDGNIYTIIGVLPDTFYFYQYFDVLVPLALDAGRAARDFHCLTAIARLKPGVPIDRARAEMNAIAANIARQYPESNKGWGAIVDPVHEALTRGPRRDAPVLMGLVAVVLLIACANVANLVLAKGTARRREIAVRASLGAGRGRLVRQFLTESVLLSGLGGALGLLLGYWFIRPLGFLQTMRITPDGKPVAIDSGVLWYTLGLSVLTGLVFGLVPPWRASRLNLFETLKQGGRGSAGTGGNRLRGALVVAEVALSMILLVCAGLMVRSLLALTAVDPGFRVDNLLAMRLELPETAYPGAERVRSFYSEVVERVSALPGITSAAFSTAAPMRGWAFGMPFEIVGQPTAGASERPAAHFLMVTPSYFDTMGIPLKKGRQFTARDDSGSVRVAIVNETFARQFLGNKDPLGQHVLIESLVAGQTKLGPPVPWEIVGISGDVASGGFQNLTSPEVYVPQAQSPWPSGYLLVRAASDPAAATAAVRNAVRSLDRDLPVSNVQTVESIRSEWLRIPTLLTGLIAGFGGLALVLALMGVYSLISYLHRAAHARDGIEDGPGRAARRPDPDDFLKQGFALAAVGIGIGLATGLAISRVLASVLFGVNPRDPASFSAAALVLLAAPLCATYIPARRAAAADPILALRSE